VDHVGRGLLKLPDGSTQTGITVAIVYDFDGTLAPGSMQEHSFIPELGYSDPQVFWDEVRAEAQRQDGDGILTYMQMMLQKSSTPVTRAHLMKHGAELPLFAGVQDWFARTNLFAGSIGLNCEHFVVSSGLREMIEASPIGNEFTHIFASGFSYSDAGVAQWPAVAINYTGKTQFLFRINKGLRTTWDDSAVNRWMPMNQRPVPFERMIFIGDGDTDIPAMKMVRLQGGTSIAVFEPGEWGRDAVREKMERLIAEDRVSYVAPADYREGAQLDVAVRGALRRMVAATASG
jgi:hypothetical protein